MKNLVYLLTLILFCSCTNTGNNYTDETINTEYLAQATVWYQKSAEMKACYYQTYSWAKVCLETNLKNYKGDKKTAVVLDIDETVLDNSPFNAYMINSGKEYTHDLWTKWTNKAKAKALPGALDFTQFAKDLGVEVFYISNRTVDELTPTVKNLKTEGFPNADSAFVYLKEETSDKTVRRKKVSDKYEILLFVGDNLTDFSQYFAYKEGESRSNKITEQKDLLGNKYIILPNPMYGEWERSFFKETKTLNQEQKLKFRHSTLLSFDM